MCETGVVIGFCTTSSPEEAEKIAVSAVEKGLAACVNIVPTVRSIYRWEGEICREQEVLCIIKTTEAKVNALQTHIRALHSYDCPEFIAVEVHAGLPDYLRWVAASMEQAEGQAEA